MLTRNFRNRKPISSSPSCRPGPPSPRRTAQSGWRTAQEPRALQGGAAGGSAADLRGGQRQLQYAPVPSPSQLIAAAAARAAAVRVTLTVAQLHQGAQRVLALGPLAARGARGADLGGLGAAGGGQRQAWRSVGCWREGASEAGHSRTARLQWEHTRVHAERLALRTTAAPGGAPPGQPQGWRRWRPRHP